MPIQEQVPGPGVAGDVLQEERHRQPPLQLPDPADRVPGRVPGQGHGQQVVGGGTVHGAEAQVLRMPGAAGGFQELRQPGQADRVEGVEPAHRQAQAVGDHTVPGQDGAHGRMVPPAVADDVFRGDLPERDTRIARATASRCGPRNPSPTPVNGEPAREDAMGASWEREGGGVPAFSGRRGLAGPIRAA